jgi:uncharacterized repeat protein (TIGR01451 family)
MGPVGNLGRLYSVALLVGVVLLLVGVPTAGSVNPDIDGFELEGNAVVDSPPKVDWNALPNGSLFFTGFRVDPTDGTDIGFASGLTKDTADISSWTWEKADVTPAKSDIVNDYGAVFQEDGSLVLYFGQNRQLDEPGDANVGFWFLQDDVALVPSPGNPDQGSFSGTHVDGDILILSEFTGGGDVSAVQIFKWQGGSLQLVTDEAECVGGKLGTEDACAIVNSGPISTSWAGTLTSPYFFEGGLNLSALFPQGIPCFSTFLTNTRTSQAENADLKDFALGGFSTCGEIEITKSAQPSDGTSFSYTTTGGLSPSSFQLTDGAIRHYEDLEPGQYSVAESTPSGGWVFDSVSCDTEGAGTSVQIGGATVSITLGMLGQVECTYVNKRNPLVRVVKATVPTSDGGRFDLQINGTTHADDVGNGGDTGFVEVAPGQVTVAETAGSGTSLPDYDSKVECDSGKGSTDPGTSHSFAAAYGDKVTCTITNAHRPTLTVVKHVINDDGGTKIAANFSISVSGNDPSPAAFPGAESPGTAVTIGPGAYSVTETEDPGYTASYSEGCSGTLESGGTATCTITNDDRPGELIVRKVVVTDDGGSARADDFSFTVNGGTAQPFEADGENHLTVPAGIYDVEEPGVAGYRTTYSNCSHVVIPSGGSATCTIRNDDVPRGVAVISVSKSANPSSLKEPGGPVTFSVAITNTSADVDVTITDVVDTVFGDLDDQGGKGYIDVPFKLHPGAFRSFQFTAQITGVGSTSHVDVVTARGHDPAGNPVSASDDARVDITPRLIDLVIVKDATSPTPLNGIVTYTLTVTNKGPETATNVQLADPAPAGITYLTATPSQGTCSVGPALVTCSLGTIAPGQTVTIRVTGRATQVGRHENTATVTGSGGRETNPADNVDSAVTIVPAPLTPPVQPKPPAPELCLALTVSPKMITADGKPDRLLVKVTAGKKRVKGAKVHAAGPGVRKTTRTNGKGLARLRVNPRKTGIITITTLERQRSCGPKRVGVVGVFLPKVTG